MLVGPLDNGVVDGLFPQKLLRRATLHHQRQFIALQKALNGARRLTRIVPNPMVITIGAENDRPLAILVLKAVGIELCLLLTDPRVAARAFGFDERQRLAVAAAQHVIDKPLAAIARHARNFDLDGVRRLRIESRLAQKRVDIEVAGFRLVVIVAVGNLLVGGADGGDLGASGGESGLQRGAALLAGAARVFGLVAGFDIVLKAPGDFLKLRQRSGGDLRQTRQGLDAENGVRRGFVALGVGARQPIGQMKKFTQGGGRQLGGDRLAVGGGVADILDETRLDRKRLPDQRLKTRFGEIGGEVIAIGRF